jgi:hypothetical protein
MQGKIGAD